MPLRPPPPPHISLQVLSLVWVACGRANACAIGLADEGGKPWDYAAGALVAAEAGASLRRLDGRNYPAPPEAASAAGAGGRGADAPFDIYARSCVCAGSAPLADELVRVLRGPR